MRTQSEEASLIAAFNYNALFIFLVANVLTGCVNFSMNTLHCSDFLAMVVLVLYALVLSSIAYFLYVRSLRVPLRLESLLKILFGAPREKVKSP